MIQAILNGRIFTVENLQVDEGVPRQCGKNFGQTRPMLYQLDIKPPRRFGVSPIGFEFIRLVRILQELKEKKGNDLHLARLHSINLGLDRSEIEFAEDIRQSWDLAMGLQEASEHRNTFIICQVG